jgi:hypothetical protein
MSTQTIPGRIIDLSSNNGHPIDYAAAKAAGVIAAIIKATDGTGYTNPYYAQDAAGFAAVGVPVLAYHFAEFGDAAAEAAHFLSVAGARGRVLDSETSQDVAWQNAFLAALNLPANEELDYGSASTLPRTGVRALLWPAAYGQDYNFGDIWQYTETGQVNGIPGDVDTSIWIGPPADFYTLFNTQPQPTPDTNGALALFQELLAMPQDNGAIVRMAYILVAKRRVDAGGFAAWVKFLDGGGSVNDFIATLGDYEGVNVLRAERKSLGLDPAAA